MSTYKKLTRHPNTGVYGFALWIDDYFGNHLYGVQFAGDEVIYAADQVQKAQLKEFWVADVIGAMRTLKFSAELQLDILQAINVEYKTRWKRDPNGGEGAIENYREKRGK